MAWENSDEKNTTARQERETKERRAPIPANSWSAGKRAPPAISLALQERPVQLERSEGHTPLARRDRAAREGECIEERRFARHTVLSQVCCVLQAEGKGMVPASNM